MLKILLLSLVLSAPIQLPKSVKPEMKVLETEQRSGYSCSLVEYNVAKGERVQAYLLKPDGASRSDKRAGLVLLHDHGARFDIGKEKLARPLASAPEYIKKSSKQWIDSGFDGVYFADSLAALGYVVVVPDMLYWGSRSTDLCQKLSRMNFAAEEGDLKTIKNAVYEGQRSVYDSLARKGIIWAEKTIAEDAAAAALLKSLNYVDSQNIGAFGWSMGAHRTWLLSAFCPDIKAGVALCWMTLKQTCSTPYKASDYSMLIPKMRESYDFYDIANWLAPKPFLFLNGKTDKLFPVWAVDQCFSRMQAVYEEAGAAGKLRTEFFDGPHHCGKREQSTIVDFLNQVLR